MKSFLLKSVFASVLLSSLAFMSNAECQSVSIFNSELEPCKDYKLHSFIEGLHVHFYEQQINDMIKDMFVIKDELENIHKVKVDLNDSINEIFKDLSVKNIEIDGYSKQIVKNILLKQEYSYLANQESKLRSSEIENINLLAGTVISLSALFLEKISCKYVEIERIAKSLKFNGTQMIIHNEA